MGRKGKRTAEEMAANKAAFLEVYKTSFGISDALKKIGLSSYNTWRCWMKADEVFAADFEEAKEVCIDHAEHFLYSGAMGKVEIKTPQFLSMAMFLKANKGEKYNDKAQFELIHMSGKQKAQQTYKELAKLWNKPEGDDGTEQLPGGDIPEVGLLPHGRTE